MGMRRVRWSCQFQEVYNKSRCLFSSLFMIPLTSCVFETFSYLWTVHALNCAKRETNRVYLTT